MSKKLIILSIILGILFVSLAGYFFVSQTSPETATSISNSFKNFFPFGNGGGTALSTSTDDVITEPTEPVIAQNFAVKLRKLSTEQVAGAGLVDVKIGTSTKSTQMGTIVRYIEKANGHIFQTELFSSNQNRISNTTIPQVADAIWGNNNMSLIGRYLKDDNQTVDTYSITLKNISTTTENIISGIAFPGNIHDVSISGTNIFYLVQNSDSSSGFVANWSGTSKKQIWSSPIRDVISQFVNANTVSLTTKPSQNLPGFMYFVNTTSGTVKKILGDIPGLFTNTSPDGTKVIYLTQDGSAQMYLYDTQTRNSTPAAPTTFPEKCVWSKKDKNAMYCAIPKDYLNGSSLDTWYRGMQQTTDDIWKYDLKNNTSNLILDLSNESSEQIDVIKPLLSDSDRYLVFMNKLDNTLWSFDTTK